MSIPMPSVDRLVDDVYEEGRQEERAAAARYLEGLGMLLLADQIARGEHLDDGDR